MSPRLVLYDYYISDSYNKSGVAKMDYQQEILKAVKEGNEVITSLKARVDELESKNTKAHRLHIGGNHETPDTPETKAQVEAYNRYLKSGDKAELKSMSVSSGPDGGFAVPKVIDAMIESVALKLSPIRQIAQTVQVSTPDYHKLINTRGWLANWAGETEARPATASAQLVDINPPMGELYANPQATQQMLDDVFFNAGTWIADEIGLAFGVEESNQFINGNGVNKPKGFLTQPISTASDATRPFGTLQYTASGAAGDWTALSATVNPADVLLKLLFSLRPGYRQGACWLMHPTLLSEIMTFKDYQGRYILQPSMAQGTPPTMWGYPIYESEFIPAKAANSLSIAFGNFKLGYLIVDRIGTRVLVDPFSAKPNVGYYCTHRVGGSCLNTEAIKILKFASA
jgi:HK97 family phage major capsid protein